jgi:chorismate mutase
MRSMPQALSTSKNDQAAYREGEVKTAALAFHHYLPKEPGTRTRRTMRLLKRDMAILIAFAIGGINNDFAQGTTDKLQPLVETSARRLVLAREVALAKWDTRSPVEDPAREAAVINAAVKDGELRGLDPTWASHFFRAQIEANKVVQYSLLSRWYRAGTAPAHRPINLATVVRPRLDQLEKKLVGQLADIAAIRTSAACQGKTAEAVAKYLAAHRHDADTLLAIALDRAMAATCYDSK